jgi:hypothetical protein
MNTKEKYFSRKSSWIESVNLNERNFQNENNRVLFTPNGIKEKEIIH